MGSMVMLDESGDTTIVWDDDTEEQLLPIIEKKMKDGVMFYIIKERALPMLPPKKVRAKKIAEIKKAGAAIIKDEDLAELFKSGSVMAVTANNDDEIVTVKRATEAQEVTRSHTVAVRPQRGG